MGIFGIEREKVGDIKRKEALRSLKQKKKEEKEKRKREALELKRQRVLAEGSLYEAKARKKKAKRAAGIQWSNVPAPKVRARKKRQGKSLSQRRRITLI